MRRWASASLASLVLIALVGLGAWMHFVPEVTFWRFTITLLALITGFYGCLRSGLNLRFADPSLTLPMVLAAGVTISIVQMDAGEARDDLMLLYPVAFLFGVYRYNTRVLIAIALLYSAFFALATLASIWSYRMALNLHHEFFRMGFLPLTLVSFAFIGGHISNLRRRLSQSNDELKAAFKRVEALANHDALTGAYSRRHTMALLEREALRTERGHTLCICMMDIDHFKSINDSHGHAAGDEALKSVCAATQTALRDIDFLGRFGGEEFVVALTQTSLQGATLAAERIRTLIAGSSIKGLPVGKQVTVSIGVAEHHANDTLDATLARADAALYQAKAAGRNRVTAG